MLLITIGVVTLVTEFYKENLMVYAFSTIYIVLLHALIYLSLRIEWKNKIHQIGGFIILILFY